MISGLRGCAYRDTAAGDAPGSESGGSVRGAARTWEIANAAGATGSMPCSSALPADSARPRRGPRAGVCDNARPERLRAPAGVSVFRLTPGPCRGTPCTKTSRPLPWPPWSGHKRDMENRVPPSLSDADEAQRNRGSRAFAAGVRDRCDHTAFRGAVELRHHQAGDAERVVERLHLRERVLSGVRVEDEQHLVRRAGERLVDDALHFADLFHEVQLRREPARAPRPAAGTSGRRAR